jgi:hypothetical protein
MKKPKKITVKFFLNKLVKPIKENRALTYPLYMLIIYNRKNTSIKSHYGRFYKNLEEVEKTHYPGFLAFEERIVKKTVEYEIARKGDTFDLKGLHDKYEKYCIGIDILFASYMKNSLWTMLIRCEPQKYAFALNFNEPNVEFATLYEMAQKLYKDFNKVVSREFKEEIEVYSSFMKLYQGSFFQYTFPTVIEWLDKSAEQDYRTKLKQIYKKDTDMIEKSLSVVNKVVFSMTGV